MAIEHLTKTNFDETIQSGTTIVDFWASWCGPCKMIAPAIEELSEKLDGKASVCKVNVDEEQELAMRYGVMSIPTVIAFKDGQEVNKVVGVQPLEAFEAMI